jgi:hypothetical protein
MSEEDEIKGLPERAREIKEEAPTPRPAPRESRAAEESGDEEKSGVSVQMVLSAETVIEVEFLQEYLRLPTRADVVAAAISISSLLLREVKQGGSVYVESRIGSKSKLSLGRKDNAG